MNLDIPAISIIGLEKRYGNGHGVVAVDGIDFEIERGTAVGLLGPNGAGKTTTIKCLLGLVSPTSGSVRVNGIDVQSNPNAAYRQIGATFEGARNMYWRLTVAENLEFFATIAGYDPTERRERHNELLEQFGIAEKSGTVVRELSRGQKQKVAITCALARDADILFLDEPTLGLDVESSIELQAELRRLVVEQETTVLVSSHDMDVIEDVCDRVIILDDGQIVADDTVENLLYLFDTKQYEVTVRGRPPTGFKKKLRTEFDADGFANSGDTMRFTVTLTGKEFYDFIDCLREAQLSVVAFDTLKADLEQVFLNVTELAAPDTEYRSDDTRANAFPSNRPVDVSDSNQQSMADLKTEVQDE